MCQAGGRPTTSPHLVAYAVKANSAGPIVRALGRAGVGAEIVSGGELEVALGCGVAPERVLWSGVAKQAWELDAAPLDDVVACITQLRDEGVLT